MKYFFFYIMETIFRFFPFRTSTGLYKIGNPQSDSPVILTCNFHLTVLKVKKALKKMDAYLLVADTKGVNVWCAAAGGHFTHHQVISAILSSGISDLVEHRRIILPQLAATGVETKQIRELTGWKVSWGPVEAKDIPAYIQDNFKKSQSMKNVIFPLSKRLEIAIMWTAPLIILSVIILYFIGLSRLSFQFIIYICLLSLFIYMIFPLLTPVLKFLDKRDAIINYLFTPGFIFIIYMPILFFVYSLTRVYFNSSLEFSILLNLGLTYILAFDLKGSTPTYKSSLHEEKLLSVYFISEKCKGAAFCELVCPRNCWTVDLSKRMANEPDLKNCIGCAACIVQCPFDAIEFRGEGDVRIPPEVIRRYKLNMMGKRIQKV